MTRPQDGIPQIVKQQKVQPQPADREISYSVFPLETRTFEEKQIFQEEQKTICAIIKPVLGIFF